MNRKYLQAVLLSAAVTAVVAAGPANGIHAYLTDMPDVLENNFTIALDSTSTVIEKFEADPLIDSEHNSASYEKAVQIANTGYLDEYVRVRLTFSEKDIEGKTEFSADGTTYHKVAEYRKQHLPQGWVYNETDGFYYYTEVLEAEGWEDTSKKLEYQENIGEYFYGEGQEILSDSCITVPLIKNVKTTFSEPKDMRSYDLIVDSESVPSYFGADYSSAWSNYLAEKGR